MMNEQENKESKDIDNQNIDSQDMDSTRGEKEEQIQKNQAEENEEIKDTGTLRLGKGSGRHNIQLMTIIGEIEGHEAVSGNTKATKNEHLIPRLAEAEDNDEVEAFHWRAACSVCRLFLYRTKRDYDCPSGAFQWNVHRSGSESPQYGKDSGSYHEVYLRPFQDNAGKTGRADARFHSARERCRDTA